MTSENIFGFPVYIGHIARHEEILEDFNKVVNDDDFFEIVESWNCNVRSSMYSKLNKIIPYHVLLDDLNDHVNKFIKELHPKKLIEHNIHNIWCNKYEQGEYQEIHNHISPKCHLSFSYMLKLPKDSGDFLLKNPIYDKWPTNDFDKMFELEYTEYYKPELEQGSIVIFPSWADHLATPNRSNESRVTIAGNIGITTPINTQ